MAPKRSNKQTLKSHSDKPDDGQVLTEKDEINSESADFNIEVRQIVQQRASTLKNNSNSKKAV